MANLLYQQIEMLSREKHIEPEVVVSAIEDAMVVAARKHYKTDGVFPWVCGFSDVEAYFCQSDYLSKLYGVSIEVADQCTFDNRFDCILGGHLLGHSEC